MPIRVTRTLVYEYETADVAYDDIKHWQVPANGTLTPGKRKRIQSSCSTFDVVDEDGVVTEEGWEDAGLWRSVGLPQQKEGTSNG